MNDSAIAPYNPPAKPPANVGRPVDWTAGVNPLSPEGRSIAETLAKTAWIPTAFRGKPDSIVVVWMLGSRLGLDVFETMRGVCEINGKPTLYGDTALAVCMRSPRWRSMVETFDKGTTGAVTGARCTIHVRTQEEPYIGEFSVQQAIEAGLWKKKAGPWTQYPERMLMMRARAYACRAAFPDALAGMHLTEEILGSELKEADLLAVDGAEPPRATMKQTVDAKHAEAAAKKPTNPDLPVIAPIIEGLSDAPPGEKPATAPVQEDLFDAPAAPAAAVTREQLVQRARAIHDGGNTALVGTLLARFKVKRLSLIAEEDIPACWHELDVAEGRA